MMLLTLLVTLLFATPASARDDYSSLIISEEIKQDDIRNNAIDAAKHLSGRNLEKMKIKSSDADSYKERKSFEDEQTSQAPFGLLWGASQEHIKNMGVILQKYNLYDYPNSYKTKYLPKPIEGFDEIVISFGKNNTLWKILAYGAFINDSPEASEILREYKKYYQLLEKKYGNAEEFYIGLKTKETTIVDNKEVEKTIEEPIGNANFLEQLRSGEAELYATFYNNEVGVALSVNVNSQGQAYLIIDYKNIVLFEDSQKEIMESL